jgi:hypothetical protein
MMWWHKLYAFLNGVNCMLVTSTFQQVATKLLGHLYLLISVGYFKSLKEEILLVIKLATKQHSYISWYKLN